MTTEETEVEIRAALSAGDVLGALSRASIHYRAPLVRFCRAFVRDDSVAEDLAQTTFAIATEKAGEFSGQSSFRTWLFGIARHKALDALAARQSLPLSELGDSAWIAESIGPLTGLRQAQDLAALERALATMNDETRAILTLRFREELSYKDISESFGITEQAARKRVFDALERLRKIIVSQGSDFFER